MYNKGSAECEPGELPHGSFIKFGVEHEEIPEILQKDINKLKWKVMRKHL